MSGYLDDLSPKQEALLEEFKIRLSDILEKKYDDNVLLQFLRARCFDLTKAEDMFRKHVQWRKQFPEDYILNDYKPPEVLRKYLVAPFLGFDKNGSPVRLVKVGQLDLRGIANSSKIHDLKDYVVWILDSDMRDCKAYNTKFNRHIETRTFIFDLKDLSIRQASYKPVLELFVAYLRLYEGNYPENLKVAVVINIPYFFAWLFNLVKSILSEDTVRKIRIYGKDGWKDELLEIVDPKILPVEYGGTRTDSDGDPTCSSLFGTAGTVPTYYYLKNQRRLSNVDEGVHQLTVGRRDKKDVEVHATIQGCSILWEADCIGHDLSLVIYYKKEVGENEVYLEKIVETEKFGGSYGPSNGTHICKKTGKYVLVFDNTFSIMRSKAVLYRVNVLPPLSSLVDKNGDLHMSRFSVNT